jgi:hypothetical protein
MSLATLLSVVGVCHAQTPAVSLDVIQKCTPTIYLHPYDNHHPMAIEPFLSSSSMLDQSGNVLKSGLTPADLATYSAAGNYLRFTNNVFPTAGRRGSISRHRGISPHGGMSRRSGNHRMLVDTAFVSSGSAVEE